MPWYVALAFCHEWARAATASLGLRLSALALGSGCVWTADHAVWLGSVQLLEPEPSQLFVDS